MPAGHTVIGGDELTNLDIIRGSAPELRFEETDQTDPAGRWRLRAADDRLIIQRALTASWATATDFITLYGASSGQGDTTAIEAIRAYTNPTSGLIGLYVQTGQARTGSATDAGVVAIEGRARIEGANSQNWTSAPLVAFRAGIGSVGTPSGTIAAAAYFRGDPIEVASGLTITELSGLYLDMGFTGAGAVTTLYGIYLDPNTEGTITTTNSYGIYITDMTSGSTLDVGLYIAGADTAAIYIAADPLRLADSVVLGLGTGTGLGAPDATLTYNGTNVVLNPAVIGSGVVAFGGGEGGTTAATGTTLRAPNIATGGAGNIAGADITVTAGLGTGTGDVGQLIFQTPRVAAAGDNIQTLTTLAVLDADALVMQDDQRLAIGTTEDTALVNSSAGVAANTALTGVLVGTPVTPIAIAANSLLVGNITASGDIILAVNKGGTSHMGLMLDASTGDTIVQAATGQSFDVYIAGVKEIDYATGALAFQQATTISSTAGPLNLTTAAGGEVVVNDASADVNFRVETDANANAFVVDAGTNTIGIGTAADPTVGMFVSKDFGEMPAGGLFGIDFSVRGGETTGASATNVIRAFMAEVYVSGTGDSVVNNQNWTATLGLIGYESTIRSVSGSSGVVTGAAHFSVTNIAANGATFTNQYGLYVAALTAATNNYGIWIATPTGTVAESIHVAGGNVTLIASVGIGAVPYAAQPASSLGVAGGVMIGASSTNNLFDDASNGGSSTAMYIGNASINVTSDVRVKSNITPYGGSALGLFRQMDVVEFDMDDAYRPFGGGVYEGRYVGMTAQALYQTAPWAVNTQGGKDCWECRTGLPCTLHLPWQVKYDLMAGVFVKGFQEVDSEVNEIRNRIAQLESRLKVLEGV